MARKQIKKKPARDGNMKRAAKTLQFLADEDPDILEDANRIKKLRKHKTLRTATRDIISEALHKERQRLEKLNKAS